MDHPRAEHVWVTDGPTRTPGLLVGWRQGAGDWQGWVVTAELNPGESSPLVQQRWVRAAVIHRRDDSRGSEPWVQSRMHTAPPPTPPRRD